MLRLCSGVLLLCIVFWGGTMKKFQIIIDKCRLCTDVWLLCVVVWDGKLSECAQHDLHMERTTLGCDLAHDMCVELLLQGDDFAGNFTFTTHTHWFPTLYNLWPSCKPIICTWLPTSDRVLATLTSKIFPVKIFCIFCN